MRQHRLLGSLKTVLYRSRRAKLRDVSAGGYGGSARPSRTAIWRLVLLGLTLVLSGCDGCRPDSTKKEGEEESEPEKIEDFKSSEIRILPSDDNFASFGVKPGHWVTVQQELKSNKADFYGQINAFAGNKDRLPFRLTHTPFQINTQRTVALPKGQTKAFEFSYFVPHEAARSQNFYLYSDLRSGYGAAPTLMQSQIANRLAPYQQVFLVLSRRPDAYGYLKTLTSIRPPLDQMSMGQVPGDYVVVIPPATGVSMLPSWPLMWTGIAYLIWDDYDPDLLSPDQQRAMVDWLHWGGQLIVNGPTSLDVLKNSFLGKYLPAEVEATRTLVESDVQGLSEYWATRSRSRNIDPKFSMPADDAVQVVDLKLRDSADYVPESSQLVVEHRVGRGRMAITRFSLTSRAFVNWRRFDNFFNGAILRRPGREFQYSLENGWSVRWNDAVRSWLTRLESSGSLSVLDFGSDDVYLEGTSSGRVPNESLVTSQLRFFSRDASSGGRDSAGDDNQLATLGWDIIGYRCDTQGGVAAWTDFSECSRLARDALRQAAGITVPDRRFILMSLGLYLFVLVPANWAIFRAIGRVEWAWVAVPVISLVGTVAVVRLAQLDIGFARSRTEIAVVEIQGDHVRAHVTRYTGLYTSLSTEYDLTFASESAVVAPFAVSNERQNLGGESGQTVFFDRPDKRDAKVRLQGMAVSSNSTGMTHSEEMVDLGGGLVFSELGSGRYDLANQTDFTIQDAGILRRRGQRLEIAWVGRLGAGTSTRVQFRGVTGDFLEPWETFGELPSSDKEPFELKPFLRLAANPVRLGEGDVRLIGWSDMELPGVDIQPSSSQNAFRTVWLANLRYEPLAYTESDINSADDFRPEVSDD